MVQKSQALISICLRFAATLLLGGLLVVSGPLTAYAAEPESNPLALSEETSFLTSEEEPPAQLLAVSEEINALTSSEQLGELAVSDEISARTLAGGEMAVSEEISVVTLEEVPSGNLVISDEISAVTNNGSSGGGGGGGGSSGGGSSSGGGGSSSGGSPPAGRECSPYLLEFIKFGRQNNSLEVLKLQFFLREFEGFAEVPVSGVYDAATFEAVKKFQLRYQNDILKPWGVTEATGYVFITTRLAINNIYCGRSTANNLDLRNYYPRLPLPGATGGIREGKDDATGTTTVPVSEPMPEEEFGWFSRFSLAALGFLDRLASLSPPWLFLFIFLVIILAFLGIYWRPVQKRLQSRPAEVEKSEDEPEEELLIEEPEEESITEQLPLTK